MSKNLTYSLPTHTHTNQVDAYHGKVCKMRTSSMSIMPGRECGRSLTFAPNAKPNVRWSLHVVSRAASDIICIRPTCWQNPWHLKTGLILMTSWRYAAESSTFSSFFVALFAFSVCLQRYIQRVVGRRPQEVRCASGPLKRAWCCSRFCVGGKGFHSAC